jgi:phosphoserine phosphatase
LCKGVFPIGPANKSYLRKLNVGDTASSGRRLFQSRRVAFFNSAIARVVEHVQQGHMIVIVSGTLPVLARPAARSLEAVVAAYGLATKVCTRATRLGRDGACWTGHLAGDAMFGAAKALAIRRLAARMNWDLRQCYGYGDSLSDRWMLETVGRPMAVNPSRGLERLARERRWPIVRWSSSHQNRHDSREEQIGSGAARSRSGRAL